MSGAGGPACVCATSRDAVVCACGALTCSGCGAVQQPAHIIDRLSMFLGYYLGTCPQNPLCRSCRARSGAGQRRKARQPKRRQRGSEDQNCRPPPSVLTQPRVAYAQIILGNGPLLTRARQLREQQLLQEGEETESTLALAGRLRAQHLVRRARGPSESPNQTNERTGSSSARGRQLRPRSSGGEPARPTRATGERPARRHEGARSLSTGDRPAMAPQPGWQRPIRSTSETREGQRRERLVRLPEEERHRHRERGCERQRQEFRQRRDTELRIQHIRLFTQNRLMRLEAERQRVRVDQTVQEDAVRHRLLHELRQRQRHERQRRGHLPQSVTTSNSHESNQSTTETTKQCTICVETYTIVEDAFPFPTALRQCSARHGLDICIVCLCYHIKSQLEARGSSACNGLKCPNLDCDHVYTYEQVKLLADVDTFARYDQHCLNTNLVKQANFRRCLRGGCSNGQIHDDLDPTTPHGNRIICHECCFVMCFKHHCPWHQGLTCEEYDLQRKDDNQETERWLSENTKPCPSCNIPIEKGIGCFHMTCQACQFEFCWECLADWGSVRSGRGGHRPDCFFRLSAAPPPTVMHGRTMMEALRNREREAWFRAQFDGLF